MTRILITVAFIAVALVGIPLLVGKIIRHGIGDRLEDDDGVFWIDPTSYINSHFSQRDGKP